MRPLDPACHLGRSMRLQRRRPVQQNIHVPDVIGPGGRSEQKALAVGAHGEVVAAREAQPRGKQRRRRAGVEPGAVALNRRGHERVAGEEEDLLTVVPPLRHLASVDGDLPFPFRQAGARRTSHVYLNPPRFLRRVSDPAAVG